MIRVVDFFSGIGGFTVGARAAGASVRLAVNHDRTALDWHAANHPDIEHECQDLSELDMRSLPDFDVLVASPECQGFTPSGQPGRATPATPSKLRREGRRRRARSTCYAVLAAADVCRPAAIVVENVPLFLKWAAFPAWRSMLEAHGYAVTEHLVTASDFGGASERRRAIILASQAGPLELRPPATRRRTIGDCLLADDDPRHCWRDVDSLLSTSKAGSMRDRIRRAQERTARRIVWANVDSARGRQMDEHFATFTTRSSSQTYLVDGDRARMLDPRELARGMSFPETTKLPSSRALAGRLIGNAIDCRVAAAAVGQVARQLQ